MKLSSLARGLVVAVAFASTLSAAYAAPEAEELRWDDLWPDGEDDIIQELYSEHLSNLWNNPVAEGSEADVGVQIGTFNVVDDLDGVRVRLPGYAVPFDFRPGGQVSEFLLVPYYGACLHQPPPPPNQTVYVAPAEGDVQLPDLWTPIWVEGEMRTEERMSDLANSAYTIIVDNVERYELP